MESVFGLIFLVGIVYYLVQYLKQRYQNLDLDDHPGAFIVNVDGPIHQRLLSLLEEPNVVSRDSDTNWRRAIIFAADKARNLNSFSAYRRVTNCTTGKPLVSHRGDVGPLDSILLYQHGHADDFHDASILIGSTHYKAWPFGWFLDPEELEHAKFMMSGMQQVSWSEIVTNAADGEVAICELNGEEYLRMCIENANHDKFSLLIDIKPDVFPKLQTELLVYVNTSNGFLERIALSAEGHVDGNDICLEIVQTYAAFDEIMSLQPPPEVGTGDGQLPVASMMQVFQ